VWLAVREFVNAAVTACAGKTAYDKLDLKIAVTKLAAWARTHAGYPLDNTVLFRREVIANFIATGATEYRPAARGNLRSQLFRMSEILLPAHAVRRLRPLPPSDPTRPYTPQEIALLRVWANTESTSARVANANVLLALGIGGGLSASEIGNVRVEDLLVDELGVIVRVTGERAREVPVVHAWEGALRVRAATLSSERFAFRENHGKFYPNLVSNFVARSHVIGPLPQTQRMRTTWIVHHLERGTPVKALLQAAGVESLEAFTRYVTFLPSLENSEYRRLLQL
jgi:integrase